MTPDPLQYQHGLPLPPQCSQWLLIPFQIRKIFQIALGQTSGPHKLGAVTTRQCCKRRKHHTRIHTIHREDVQEELPNVKSKKVALQGSYNAQWGGQRRKVREAGVSSTRIPSTARQISKQPESFQPCSGLGTPSLTANMVVGFRTWLTLRSSVHLPWSLS